jgi:hypothetical protein
LATVNKDFRVKNNISLASTADTATAATHYFVETATDGVIRPKTLANARTEIVTTAAVNSAAATTVGTVTSGTWNAGVIAGQYGGTGVANTGKTITIGGNFTTSGAFTTTLTVTGNTNVTLPTSGTLATLASPAFTGTPTAPTATAGTNTTQIATTAFVASALSGVTGGASYQTTAPVSPTVGQIWVDSDEVVTSLNSNDFLLKSGGTMTGNLVVNGSTTLASLVVNGYTFNPEEFMVVSLSDETTALTTGTAKLTWRAPYAMTLTQIPRASLSTASSSGLVTVDINEGGTSVLGASKLSIDANEKTSTTAATATTLADAAISDDAEITFDIDAAGTGAKGLKVIIYYRRA